MRDRFFKAVLTTTFICCALTAHAETVLVTGANKGIGLEFAKQFAEKGWHVIATHRRDEIPQSLSSLQDIYPKVQIENLEVTSDEQIGALVDKLNGQPIDILINNAGVMGLYLGAKPGELNENFGTIDVKGFDTYYQVNVRAPVMISEALYENVKASKMKLIASVSSRQGSMNEALYGGSWVWYGGSKAALNRTMIGIADGVRKDGVTVLLLAPTLTFTERTSVMRKSRPDGVDVDEAVAGFINTLTNANIEDTGKIFHWDGTLGTY